MMTSGRVLAELQRCVTSRNLRADPAQRAVASRLDALLPQWMQTRGPSASSSLPWGVYIHGGVGTGKSLVLDCLHRVASNNAEYPTSRMHFHEFMLGVHARLHVTKSMDKAIANIAGQTRLICFDEFQVTDVADAVLLHRLFRGLWERGTVVVATSNRAPCDLYTNGINRQALFLPFEKLLLEQCDVLDMDTLGPGIDYRSIRGVDDPIDYTQKHITVIYPSSDPRTHRIMKARFNEACKGSPVHVVRLEVGFARVMDVQRSTNGVYWTSFEELCRRAVGAADYMALAANGHTVFLDSVPVLGPGQHNEARRFITLIDVLYDRGCILVVSAETPLERLFEDISTGVVVNPQDSQVENVVMTVLNPSKPREMEATIHVTGEGGSSGRSTTMMGENVEWSATGRMHASLADIAAVHDVSFAFTRALSRLVEMQSNAYRNEHKQRFSVKYKDR